MLPRPVELGQYTSILMGKTLRALGVVASMGSRGCAYDNAACESAIGTIKLELVEQHLFATRDVARLSAYHATLTEAAIAA